MADQHGNDPLADLVSDINTPEPTPRVQKKSKKARKRYQAPQKNNIAMRFLWGLLALPLLIGIGLCSRSSDNDDVRQEMLTIVKEFPNYREKANYYKKLVNMHHEAAFDKAYKTQVRRSNEFDPKMYIIEISQRMIKTAQRDGETEVAELLSIFLATCREMDS